MRVRASSVARASVYLDMRNMGWVCLAAIELVPACHTHISRVCAYVKWAGSSQTQIINKMCKIIRYTRHAFARSSTCWHATKLPLPLPHTLRRRYTSYRISGTTRERAHRKGRNRRQQLYSRARVSLCVCVSVCVTA